MEKVLLSISQLHHDPVGWGLLLTQPSTRGPQQGRGAQCPALQVAARGKDKDARLEATASVCCAGNLQVCGSKVRRQLVMKFCV